MPRGVYQRSPEQIDRVREQARNINLGKSLTEEHKEKLCKARRARTDKTWNKGKTTGPLSVAHRAKIGQSLQGHEVSEKTRLVTAEKNRIHDHAHRGSQTPTYQCWAAMLRRCRNKNTKDYPGYGGRGISVCERWLKYENFLADMGERPLGLTLDRINNDGNYEVNNCRWATHKEQAQNRRKAISA
ncbi:MAG: hypothetical protein WC454_09595 [Phycisphaerae bacterium]|jgi:hypothetical protein